MNEEKEMKELLEYGDSVVKNTDTAKKESINDTSVGDTKKEGAKGTGTKKRLKKSVKVFLLIVLAVLLGAGGMFAYQRIHKIRGTIVVESDDSLKAQQEVQHVDDTEININYSLDATFDTQGTSTSFFASNSVNNNGDIKFTIYDENGVVIYESDPLETGYTVSQVQLDKNLSKGKHEGYIKFEYVDSDESSNVSNLFNINLTVE